MAQGGVWAAMSAIGGLIGGAAAVAALFVAKPSTITYIIPPQTLQEVASEAQRRSEPQQTAPVAAEPEPAQVQTVAATAPVSMVAAAGDMEVRLQNCDRASANVTCTFDVVNVSSEDRSWDVYSHYSRNYQSSFYDVDGERHSANRVVMGDESREGTLEERFPVNIPRRASLVFSNVPANVTSAVRLEIRIENEIVSFDNVPIT